MTRDPSEYGKTLLDTVLEEQQRGLVALMHPTLLSRLAQARVPGGGVRRATRWPLPPCSDAAMFHSVVLRSRGDARGQVIAAQVGARSH